MKNTTIIKAIETVLLQHPNGLNLDSIFESIETQNLYKFNAKTPKNVVNWAIRRHCLGLDFPTANPVKYFYIIKVENGKPIYDLIERASKQSTLIDAQLDLIDSENELPEETVEKTIKNYNEKIKMQLMDKIMNNDPSFFEQLVVNLLLKMGYGYDKNSGLVVGKSHDGGIDGIIREDKLGLDQIYIQAKRYAKHNTVGRKELQAFIGAMEGVSKGLFFTTSNYTKEALEYIDKIQIKRVRLIDGDQLLDYMLKYEVGVQTLKEYKILKIDDEFFV